MSIMDAALRAAAAECDAKDARIADLERVLAFIRDRGCDSDKGCFACAPIARNALATSSKGVGK